MSDTEQNEVEQGGTEEPKIRGIRANSLIVDEYQDELSAEKEKFFKINLETEADKKLQKAVAKELKKEDPETPVDFFEEGKE